MRSNLLAKHSVAGAALAPHWPRLFASLTLLTSSWIVPLRAQTEGATVGTKAPVVMVSDLSGKMVRVGHVQGKRAAVIEFWATWCELCKELLPRVRAAQQRFGDRVDFYGVNVTVNESKARVQRYVAREKPPWVTLYDERGVAVRAFKAPATSYVVIVDRDGMIRYVGSGGTQDLAAELALVVGQ